MDEIESDLNAAVMGDPEAISRVAARLRATQPAVDPERRERFLDAVAVFREEFRDVVNNPDDFATARQVDLHIAQEHPELDALTRLRIAGNQVRSGQYDTLTEEMDRANAIQQMRDSRKGRELPNRREPRAAWDVNEDDDNSQAIARLGVRGRFVSSGSKR